MIEAWEAGAQAPRDGGVYWQAVGPRFETPAEIRLIAPHADVVGMTIASECVVAREPGLEYAALCVVDNLANGVGPGELTVVELDDDRAANASLLRDGLERCCPGSARSADERRGPDRGRRRARRRDGRRPL